MGNLIKEPTCFKGSPSCIDLIITNRKPYFKKTCLIETGLSDFHKLTVVSLKSQILKAPPKRKLYRDYKTFDENNFNNDLKSKLDTINNLDYITFEDIFISVLNTHAPIKTKILRASNHKFMTKALRKAIMTRSRLKSIYLKNQNTTNWNNCKSQRNFCTNLLRKTRRDYFRNLNIRELNDNKKFWKRIKPFFSDKGLANNSIVLKENGNLITDTQELANLFNTYYLNLINTLQLKKSTTEFKSLSEILSFYKNHDSISKIKAGNNLQQQFHFKEVSSNEVKKIIKSLNTKKSALLNSS